MLGIEKSIYAPLRVSGETQGLLGVASTGLTEADVPAVTVFANQAGIAIENAQLLEQVGASRERLRRLTQQIVSAQEEERQRLSRALHDEAGQALTALRISLELIQDDLPVEFDLLRQRIGDAAALSDATMEQIRLLAQDLRPPALDAVGLNPTLEAFCRDFAKRTQLPIDYLGLGLPMLPEAVTICLYRFLQEALTNVAKHACASQVCVTLRYEAETVSLSVEDDGRGFDRQARLSVLGWPMGIGLLGMQERLESLGGRLEIESQPGQGTRLVAHLPAGGIP
jgi:signal transduction histidine kinase